MVIAHVIESLEIGGAEQVVAALARLQAAAGHSPHVHCVMKGGSIADALNREGIPVWVHAAPRTRAVMWSLFRRFRRSAPEVVHCHNKAATLRAAPMARLAGVPTVVSTRHGMAIPPYRLRKELKYWLTTLCFCDRVVAVCDAARANMHAGAGLAARGVVTIRNGAYPPAPRNGREVHPRGFTLVSVGRLAKAQNYATLLHGVALARRRVPDLNLWIVGDGPERTSLRRLSSELALGDAVRLFGEQGDVGPYLRAADVFVLSSVSEGLPISLLEAMAVGLPAIVTDVGGMPEVIRLSGAGRTVPAGEAEPLAAAIVEFAAARGRLGELGQRAALCYARHFTPERMADDYVKLYERLRKDTRSAVA